MAMSLEVERTFRLGDVFSKSFSVFGRHVIAFVLLAILSNIPAFVMAIVMGFATLPTAALIRFLTPAVTIICWMIANGAMTYGVVQDLRGGNVSIAQAIAIAARRFLPMIGVAISTGFLICLAGLLLLVPGLIVFCMYYVAAPVCIAEQVGVGASLSRSRFLTKGHRWQVFGALILIFIIEAIVASAIFGVIHLAVSYAGAAVVSAATSPAGHVLSIVVQAVFTAFNAVIASVFYYELRVAKEGIDLAKIASVFD
jgi:uncharacterized membrane protein